MQQATIKSSGHKRYRLEAADGLHIEIHTSGSERAQFEFGEQTFDLTRERHWGDFLLEASDSSGEQNVIARATKRSAFSRKFDVVLGGREYKLVPVSCVRSSYRLIAGNRTLVEIKELGFFRTRFEVYGLEKLAPANLVFVAWLVLIMWQRENDVFVPPVVG